MPRAHYLSYPVEPKDDEHLLKLSMRRDLGAIIEPISRLHGQGFAQGEPIFNQPPDEVPEVEPTERYPVDLSFTEPDDVIVHCGRPPMDDFKAGHRKKYRRAYTDLEDLVFLAWRQFLEWCSRDRIELKPALKGLLRPGFEDRLEMKLYQTGSFGPYKELNAHNGKGWHRPPLPPHSQRTPLFLLRVDHLREDLPGYLGLFGMDGIGTSVLAYRAARKLWHLIERPAFVLAELEIGEMPVRATDMRWCASWKIEVLLQHELAGSLVRV
jgi:hypothetical protein